VSQVAEARGRAGGAASPLFELPHAVGPGERGSRTAALLLHAMLPEDRTWLLEQLNPGEQASLDGLLGELGALGIPGDATLVDRALREKGQHSEPSQPVRPRAASAASVPSAEEIVATAPPSAIAGLFCEEPPGLIAALLGARDWPWRAEVLLELGAYVRLRVEEALDAEPVADPEGSAPRHRATALEARLIAALASRLRAEEAPPAPPAPAQPSLARSLLDRWGGGARRLGRLLDRSLGR